MNEKHSLLIELIKLAKADKEFHEKEYAFLVEIARLLGIEKAKLDELFENILNSLRRNWSLTESFNFSDLSF
jgi:uncharacterized tellurite resistance protein B-like protein